MKREAGKTQWQRVIDRESRTRGIDTTKAACAKAVARRAMRQKLTEMDCIVQMGLEKIHPQQIRIAMFRAGFFKERNVQSATALIYHTLNHFQIPYEVQPQLKKPVRRVAVADRIERMNRLIEFLHTPRRLTALDIHARRNVMEDAG